MKNKKDYWKKASGSLLALSLLLIGIGLVAVSSASAVLSFERFGHNNYYLYRQLMFSGIGLVFLYVFSLVDYHFWRKWNRIILIGSIGLLGLVLVPSIGFQVGPARSWFSIGPFLFQPSEFVKLAVIFFLASWFERKKDAEQNFWFGVVPPLLAASLVMGLVLLESDTGTTLVIALISGAVMFSAGIRIRFLSGLAAAGAVGLWLLIRAAPYRAARIVTFLDPTIDPQGIGYHINQALLGIGSGGFWGYGFGLSRQKHNYLPEPIGDSIFAVMAEEMGFLRILVFLGIFILLGIIGIRIAKHAPDKFGSLTAAGITAWIVLQALVNIASISGLMPLTGITLPFISYGGSSLLALCIGVGIMLNISRQRE